MANKKKLINKRKKQIKILILEPKTSNNFKDKYSKQDKARKQQGGL